MEYTKTTYNPTTGDLLVNKTGNQETFGKNLAVVLENSRKNADKGCDECGSIPCPFPVRKEIGSKCSFWEEKQ